jgi:hypothetical protein
MKDIILKKLIKEEIKNILREGDNEHQNYMFFQNLHTIKKMVEKMLQLNPQEVDTLLSNGHGWAVDHISTSADDVGEVGTWLCNELEQKMNNTSMMSEGTHPWYTSANGYYKGQNVQGVKQLPGPKHTGNVSQYLKPNVTVYNDKGESKTIKTVSDSHLQFSDGTEDYFMNWFVEKP